MARPTIAEIPAARTDKDDLIGASAEQDSKSLKSLLDLVCSTGDNVDPATAEVLAISIPLFQLLREKTHTSETSNLLDDEITEIRNLPAYARAAIANGYLDLSHPNTAHRGTFPTIADGTSVDLETTCAKLLEIAKAITEAELLHIAKADYQNHTDAHYNALKQVIFEQGCVFEEDQSWVPSEVVELVSHVPGDTGFAVATAVLLHHCLRKGDYQGHTEFRWQNNATAYLALPPSHQDPILAAFRYLYESDPLWDPYYSGQFDPCDYSAVLLPMCPPELTQM